MLTILVFLLVAPMLAPLASCSDLSPSSEGTGGTSGTGGVDGIVDPEPKSRAIGLGCTNNLNSGSTRVFWELQVDPGPIVAGEAFGAVFRATAVFSDIFFDVVQQTPGGAHRIELLELQGTVHIRHGASGPDVVLVNTSIAETCRYDASGNADPGAGPFPTCSRANDNPDGSNDDCIGLGGVPSTDNPCGQFVTIPTSSDCAPGGQCDTLDRGFGLRNSQCVANGFCVAGPVEVPLEGSLEGYIAEAAGDVAFGWDDQGTGVSLEEGGHNDGTFMFPPAVFEDPVGPNGARAQIGDLSAALECTMAVESKGPDGVDSRIERFSPTPDWKLISFAIQTR